MSFPMSFPTFARQYSVPVEKFYQKDVFDIGICILYRYFYMKGHYQYDITVKNANGTWENFCYINQNDEKIPYFDLYGPVWDHFRYVVKFELLKKVDKIDF